MASLTATEPAIRPGTMPAESVVPACMFAPDRGYADDPCCAEGIEDGDCANGESADHFDLSSKVGLTVNCTCLPEVLKFSGRTTFFDSITISLECHFQIQVVVKGDTGRFDLAVQNTVE